MIGALKSENYGSGSTFRCNGMNGDRGAMDALSSVQFLSFSCSCGKRKLPDYRLVLSALLAKSGSATVCNCLTSWSHLWSSLLHWLLVESYFQFNIGFCINFSKLFGLSPHAPVVKKRKYVHYERAIMRISSLIDFNLIELLFLSPVFVMVRWGCWLPDGWRKSWSLSSLFASSSRLLFGGVKRPEN